MFKFIKTHTEWKHIKNVILTLIKLVLRVFLTLIIQIKANGDTFNRIPPMAYHFSLSKDPAGARPIRSLPVTSKLVNCTTRKLVVGGERIKNVTWKRTPKTSFPTEVARAWNSFWAPIKHKLVHASVVDLTVK